MGYISDRTVTRWGRRRPYILFGAVPVFLAMVFFFTKPDWLLGADASPLALAVWAALALMLLNTASTVINIPYSSLTPELTDDYHERTSLNGYRFGCAVFGTSIGAAAVQPIAAAFPTQARGFSAVGAILGGIVAVTSILTFLGTKERPRAAQDRPDESFFATYKQVFTNKPYILLLVTYALHLCALTFLQGILVYYTKYISLNEGLATPAMVALLLVAMVFIPISVLVAKKIGKKAVYQICFAILASTCLVVFFLGHILGQTFFIALMLYGGIGLGFSYVAPFAMVPDAVEYDAVRTGKRKEGAYYGIWTFIAKVGQSLSVFLSGVILSAGGYIADAAQSASSIFSIRLIIGPIPAVIFIAAIIVIQFYPLDEKTYNILVKGGDHV
jgi:GPH family glycoside/pentoside/hexuronide:cation symporter